MERGDIVIYFCNQKPMVGKYVNTKLNGRLVIIPKRGGCRAIRNKNQVLSVNELFNKYSSLLKGQTK